MRISLSVSDDWLALAWCLVTMALAMLLIRFATVLRPRRTSRPGTSPRTLTAFMVRHETPIRGSTCIPALFARHRIVSSGEIPLDVQRIRRPPRF